MGSANEMIRSHWRLIVVILVLVLVFWFLWALRSVLLPFVVGFILAYLLLPMIRWAEKRLPGAGKKPKLKRITVIVAIYLLSLAVIVLAVLYFVTVMATSLLSMIQDAPKIIPDGLARVTAWLKSLPVMSPPSVQQQIDAYSARAAAALGNAMSEVPRRGGALFQSSSAMILGFAVMPIFVFFILKDWDRLRDRFYATMPSWTRTHTKNILSILQNVVGRYIRAQLSLGVVVGLCAYVLLMILGIEFALPLAVFAGITEMVPMIGPWLGGGLAVLVTLSTEPDKAIWVALGFLLIQLIENNVLVPKIQSSQMQIHPAFIILLSVLGAHFAGILGFVIVLPLTVAIIRISRYLWDSTRDGVIS